MIRTMDSHGGRRAARIALLLALGALGACGSEEQPEVATDPSSTGSAPTESSSVPADAPGCAEVWQEGARLPRGYRGCVDAGEFVDRDAVSCSSGQRLVRHADRYYGVLGGTVHEVAGPLADDRDYRAALRSCTA